PRRLFGFGAIGHAGEMDDEIALVEMLNQQSHHIAQGNAETLVLRVDLAPRSFKGLVQYVAPDLEVVAGRTEKDRGDAHGFLGSLNGARGAPSPSSRPKRTAGACRRIRDGAILRAGSTGRMPKCTHTSATTCPQRDASSWSVSAWQRAWR